MSDAAFARDMMSLRPRLVSFARHLCKDMERAEDLASEAIARGWRARASFEPGTKLGAWLSFILRNQFITEQRRKKWDGGSIDAMDGFEIPCGASQEHHMALRDLERAMALIPADQKAAVIAVALNGSYEEAAEAMHECVGTIKSRACRGRAALVELLA